MAHEGYTASGRPLWTDPAGRWHAWRVTGTYDTRAAAETAAANQDQEDQMTENLPAVPTVTGELVRTDMRDRATDSWTAVISDAIKLGGVLASTEFVPVALRTPEKTTAAIMYSRELGLPPMTGLASVYVVEGRPGLYAETMRSMIIRDGHQFRIVESTDARCVIKTRRKEWASDDWNTHSFTYAEAQKAGLVRQPREGKKAGPWLTMPADMLVARCTTRAARRDFPDVIHGMRSVEELQDMTEETVRPTPVVSPSQGQTVQRRQVGGAAAVPSGEPGGEGDADDAGEGSSGTVVPSPPPAAPARKRAEVKARGSKPPAGDESANTIPADVPEDPHAEAVELAQAEISELAAAHREDRAAGGPPLHTPAADPDMINPTQRTKLMAEFTRLKIDRPERLRVSTEIVGRLIETANDLTYAEASRVIEVISRPKDARALDAAIATLPDPDADGADQ